MSITILQWNLNGFYNNLHQLQILIREKSPDIIALQETHHSMNPLHLNGYISCLSNTDGSSRGGTALFIKNNLKFNFIMSANNFSVTAEVFIGFKLKITSVYLNPSDPIPTTELSHFFKNNCQRTIILVDFNAHSTLWGSPTTTSRGLLIENLINDSNMTLLNDGNPTHFSTRSTFTHVDLSFTSADLTPFSSWNIDTQLNGSDHFPIHIRIEQPNFAATNTANIQTRYNIDKADWKKFQEILSNIVISDISTNINKEAARLQKIIKSATNNSIPIYVNNKRKKYTYWWNNELQILRDSKQRLFNTFKKHPTTENRLKYKKARALFKFKSKAAKRDSFYAFTSDINPNTPIAKIWNNIQRLNGTQTFNIIRHIEHNNQTLNNSNDIANLFADSYSQQSNDDNFNDSFKHNKNIVNKTINYELNSTTKLLEEDITLFEFQSTLHSLKGKTPGFDKISYPILKHLPPNTSQHLIRLFNSILNTGVIPQQWKTSTIIPILKPNKDKTSVNSYRPISLIPCTSKILEKIIATRITWALLKNKHLSNHQVAFKPNKGTIDAHSYIDHIIASNLSHRNHLSILSIDFDKAFDRVGIHTVISQLKEWKFGKKIINFIYAFLTNRKIRIKVNNVYSSTKPLYNGIPQGSPLSVVLFQIATDKLNKIISDNKFFKHVMYADDLYIISKNGATADIQQEIDELFVHINNWCDITGSKISITKTKCLHVCKKLSCSNTNITIQGNQIETVDSLKILGVIFNKRFTWSSHIDVLKKSLQPRLNLIKCIAAKISNSHPTTILNAIRSIILSKIDYGLTIYGKAPISQFKKIQPMYNAAIRLALGALRTTPIRNLMAESGLPNLKQRFESLTSKLIIKVIFPAEQHLLKRISHIPTQRPLKYPSTICIALKRAKDIDIDVKPQKTYFPLEPPWKLNKKSFVDNLMGLSKNTTPNQAFLSIFNEVSTSFKNSNWNFIYTDGSKTTTSTTMAIINQHKKVDFLAILDQRSSIFTAESTAIFCALKKYKNIRGKFLICSDSKSTITAIQNIHNRNITISKIRDILIKYPNKFKIMWIPGHIGILGNTLADEAAKYATIAPIIRYPSSNKIDIAKIIYTAIKQTETNDWINYNHHYKNFNPNNITPSYPSAASKNSIQKYIRLRLGHTYITHRYLLNRTNPEICPLCNTEALNIHHLIFNCESMRRAQITLLEKICLPDLLKNITIESINSVQEILKYCNIYHLI